MTYPKLSTAIALAIISLFTLGGCSAAFLEYISTERFTGKETTPFTTEHCVGDCTPSRVGITKSLAVHNPTGFEIEAFLSCSSMYQADFTMIVKAHTTKWQFVGANNSDIHDQACYLMDWKPNYAKELANVR
jgi:hypothetical protein